MKQTKLQADITIVGAGIIGLTTAVLLKKIFPTHSIIVVDQALAGAGASFYGGAADVPFAPTKWHQDTLDFGRLAQSNHPEIIPPGYALDTYWIAEQKDIEHLNAALWPNDLIPSNKFNLPINLSPSQRIFFSRQGKVGSPRLACEVLMQRLRGMSGVTVMEGCCIKQIEPGNDSVLQVYSACGHRISSRAMVLAVGPWLPEFISWIPESVSIRNKKIIAFHINQPWKTPTFCIQYFLPDMYFIPDPVHFDRWIFCIRSEQWDCAPTAGQLHISASEYEQARAVLDQYAPALQPYLQGGRVFCDAYQASHPFVARHPQLNNLIIAGACSGSGYRLAAGMAQRVKNLLQVTL